MDTSKMTPNALPPVILVPGGVTPAPVTYGALLNVIKDQSRPVAKELEVYRSTTPPPNYGMELEVEDIKTAADTAGFQTFHLVGFSYGGACSLAFAAQYSQRLKSLALIEPGWIGNQDWTAEDAADWAELERVMALEGEERMRAFARSQMKPGLEPPALPFPPGDPPEWMMRRPNGLGAIARAFKAYSLDRQRFRDFKQPVYYAYGDRSHPIHARNAKTLAGLFPNMRVEMYAGRSHFDPPHFIEPERFAQALRALWLW